MSGHKFRNIPKAQPRRVAPPKGSQFSGNLGQKIDQAIELHAKNELSLAKPLYKEILTVDPNHFDALHYLGVIHYQQGDFQEALALIERAVKIFPAHSVSQSNLGNVYQALARLGDAQQAYTRSLELNPQFADAYFNLGVVSDSLNLPQCALDSYNRCLVLNSNFAPAYNNRALTLRKLAALGKAVIEFDWVCRDYELATHLNPNFAQAFFNWGVALHENQDLEQALIKYNTAIRLDPHFATVYNNRGNLLLEMGDFEAALQSLTKALELNPQFVEAQYNRGALYQGLERYELARADYDAALLKSPTLVQAVFNRGSVLEQLKRFELAQADFFRSIELSPEFANAHFNLSLLLLRTEQFEQGWGEFEWRWKSDDFKGQYLSASQPQWHPGLDASTIFVWNEQGVGDDIFFLPWLTQFVSAIQAHKPQPVKVVTRVDARLVQLFKRSLPEFEFVDRQSAPAPDSFDAHLAMGSLPLALTVLNPGTKVLNQTLDTTQSHEQGNRRPYLQADKSRANQLREQLVQPGEVLIGISWRSKNVKTGASRSIDLQHLVSAINRPAVKLVNLQYGEVQTELASVSQSGVGAVYSVPGVDVMQDLDGLSSLISACDLVVSADNTTVHLSGALGVKTLVMLPYTADWRWGEGRSQPRWYQGVELFRQSSRGEWGGVLERVAKRVDELIVKLQGE